MTTTDIERHLDGWVAAYDSPHTRRAYEREGRSWLDWCQRTGTDPLDTDRATVNKWKNTPTADREAPAPATKLRRLAAVSSFYQHLLYEGVIECNPLIHVRRPKIDPDFSETRGLTRDEAARLLAESSTDPVAHALVCLLMVEGLRVSEAMSARIENLHHSRGTPTLTVTRKGGQRQTVPLGPATLAAVHAARGDRDRGPILATSSGGPYSYAGLYRMLRRVVTAAGLDDPGSVSPHSLRHTFATLALDAGAHLRDVQDALSHRDPRTTRRYDRSRGAVDRHPAAALEEYLTQPVESLAETLRPSQDPATVIP